MSARQSRREAQSIPARFSRAGATLVECLVALVVLGVGVLGVSGAGIAASRMLLQAEREQVAALHAAALLDSLVVLERPAAGSQLRGSFRADWSTSAMSGGTLVDVMVVGSDGRVLATANGVAAPWPPRIGRIP